MIILSIETSCDETAAAIIKAKNKRIEILSNIVSSQIAKHKKFGGVVPQMAAGLHQKNIVKVLDTAFKKAKIPFSKIDLIAVTVGPGLIPALLVGTSAAKALAWKWQKPIIGVNHMEGHVLSALISGKNFSTFGGSAAGGQFSVFNLPALALLVSGGHTELVLMEKWLNYKIIGKTRDDAAGEAFDKVGKMLGLGYPAGAKIEQLAKKGDSRVFNFPSPMLKSNDYDFSFAGLKTAVKNTIELLREKRKNLSPKEISDVAASFQKAVIDVLVAKTVRAAKEYNVKTVIIGGGVAANKTLCNQLKKVVNKNLPKATFLIPRKEYTGDNAAMIALAGYFRRKTGGEWKSVRADADMELK